MYLPRVSAVHKNECLKICILKKSDVGMAWNCWSKNNSLMVFYSHIFRKKTRTPNAIFSALVDQVFLPYCMEYIYPYSGFLHFHPIPSPSASYEHRWNHLCRLHTFMEISVEDAVTSLTFVSGLRFNSKRCPGVSNVVWLQCSLATDLQELCTLS